MPDEDALEDALEDARDNAQWRALLADPRSGPLLDELIARARQSPKHPWPPLDDEPPHAS
jgi:hypothetical protein